MTSNIPAHLLDPGSTVQCARKPELFLPSLEMFSPQGHSEHVHITIRVEVTENIYNKFIIKYLGLWFT